MEAGHPLEDDGMDEDSGQESLGEDALGEDGLDAEALGEELGDDSASAPPADERESVEADLRTSRDARRLRTQGAKGVVINCTDCA
jgi:hypothetical protein